MKLRKPCRHGWYDEHMYYGPTDTKTERCPGGVFLPDDTLRYWVTRSDGEPMGEFGGYMVENLDAAKRMVREELEIERDRIDGYEGFDLPNYTVEVSAIVETVYLDALSVREAE